MHAQTLALGAICQAAKAVQSVAKTGQVDEDTLTIMLNSIVDTSPDNVLAVYGNATSNLHSGLRAIGEHLGNDSNEKDAELTRYIVSLMALERNLARRKNQLSALGERIEQSKRQLAHYEINSETLISSFASIYSDLISPLGTPIQVTGEPSILKQTPNQHKIRALLLAGIRACVLWRQVGGKRRNILFSRGKIVANAQELLRTY